MSWSIIYGLATGLVLLAALQSRSAGLQKLALLLLLEWSATNLAVNALGFDRAGLAIPSINAAIAVMVGFVGYKHSLRGAIYVFALYMFLAAIHVAARVLHATGSNGYYVAMNAVFAAQLVCVGGLSGRLAVCRWFAARRERARHHLARG